MEYFLGRPAAWWLAISHEMDKAGITSPEELGAALAHSRRVHEVQLTPDEAGYYFGMDPAHSQWWFDAAARYPA